MKVLEDFATCSQAPPTRHEEKWDARVRLWCSTRTLQVAARLPQQGTKKNGTLAYDSDAARGLCKLQPGYPSKARRKNGTLAYDTHEAGHASIPRERRQVSIGIRSWTFFSSCWWRAQLARLDSIEIFVRVERSARQIFLLFSERPTLADKRDCYVLRVYRACFSGVTI